MNPSNHNPDEPNLRPATVKPSLSKRGGGMPRIMWLAIMVCILGAAFLFRSQSPDVPVGIGESKTVITAPEVESTLPAAQPPRSGDVNIAAAAPALTPEKAATPTVAKATEPAETAPKTTPQKATRHVKHTPTPTATVTPLPHGPYVVQAGSFGEANNADQEAARLNKHGWDARVKVGNTSSGDIIYRVHIGYFKSRHEAATFVRQNNKLLRGAIAIHR